jgi:FkbM family methyltransferase
MKELNKIARDFVFLIYSFILKKFCHLYKKEKFGQILKLIEINHTKFVISIESRGYIEDKILKHGDWSGNLLEICDYFIAERTIIVDVGANIGFESLYFAKKYPNCKIYSYEPTSYAFNSLKISKEINFLSNLTIYKLGLGESEYNIEIHSPTSQTKNKGLSSIKNNYDLDSTFEKEPIQVVSLDSHLKDETKVSLIKIDTQGYELNILIGAKETIRRCKPVILFEHEDEYYENPKATRIEIFKILSACNYKIFVPSHNQVLKAINFEEIEYFNGDVFAVPI